MEYHNHSEYCKCSQIIGMGRESIKMIMEEIVSRCSLHASCLQFAFEEAIHITGALEVEAGLGVAELQEEA